MTVVHGWDSPAPCLLIGPLCGPGAVGHCGASGDVAGCRPQANSIAQQAISQIRTVAANGQEEQTIREYDDSLEPPYKVRCYFFWAWHTTVNTLIIACICDLLLI
jgi:hypothetical protein